MKVAIRKLEITEIGTVEQLVVENIDNLEPGLAVIDQRLLLGHSTIDLVARDAAGSLVLIALGLRADESMLLRIVDAYSWCLEYPESVERHYPALSVSEERPPRVVFVMSRVPESFQRKLKQLSFSAVDAVELHSLDIDGVPAVFFDTVARIRRTLGVPTVPDIAARPRPEPRPPAGERSVRFSAGGTAAAPTAAPTLRVPAPIAVPAAPIVTIAPPVIAGASDAIVIQSEPAVAVDWPVAAADEPAVAADEPAVAVDWPAGAVEEPVAPVAEPGVAVAEPVAPVAEAVPALAEAAVETASAPESQVAAPAPAAAPAQKYPFSEAAKAAQLAKDLGIELPKEGALTRQWIDFLNQLAAK